MYGARSICPAVARRVRVGHALQSRRKHQHFHHHHHSTARRTIYSNKADVEIQRRCLTVCPPLFGSDDDPANPTSTSTSTGTSRGGAGKGKENSKWMVQIPRCNKEGADTQPTTMTPEPPPGSRWEQMLLRAGEAGEGEAVEVVEYSTPGPPRAPRLGIGRGKRGLFRHTEVKVPAGLVSPKLTLIGMCDNDIDTRVAKLEEEAGLPSLDALRIALALSFVHKLDFPPTFAAVVKELQRVQADIATVVLDQPFLFTAHPDEIAERLASLEKAGLLAEDVGEIVTKQPSLLALPVDAELFSRPAARYDVEVGPESSAYAEVAKALKMRRQLRRWESPQETEAAPLNPVYTMKVCASIAHGRNAAGMSVIQADFFSGFVLGEAVGAIQANNPGVKLVENYGTGIAFYIDEITADRTCVKFEATRAHKVGEVKPIRVRAYDYYELETSVDMLVVADPTINVDVADDVDAVKCRMITAAKLCRAESKHSSCFWDRKDKVCIRSEVSNEDEVPIKCNDFSKRNECKTKDSCTWKARKKQCTEEDASPACQSVSKRNACKETDGCQWKAQKKQCIMGEAAPTCESIPKRNACKETEGCKWRAQKKQCTVA